MRRVLRILLLLAVGGTAAVLVRRSVVRRPAGTPSTWPAVPRKPQSPSTG